MQPSRGSRLQAIFSQVYVPSSLVPEDLASSPGHVFLSATRQRRAWVSSDPDYVLGRAGYEGTARLTHALSHLGPRRACQPQTLAGHDLSRVCCHPPYMNTHEELMSIETMEPNHRGHHTPQVTGSRIEILFPPSRGWDLTHWLETVNEGGREITISDSTPGMHAIERHRSVEAPP